VFESERKVVYSERRSGIDNNNFRKLGEQVQATAYVAHPYQFTVIGWPSDIESWTQEDLVNYYRTYYAPNNRTVVVTGDVTTEEIFALAEEYLAPTPAQEPPPPIRTVEPEQLGPRRLVVETSAQTPMLHLAFHAANAAAPETLSMNLLLNILVGGESSRLHQLLVEKEGLAISVDGYQDEGFDPGLAYFYLTLPPGGDPAELERRMLEELTRVADEGVTDAELNKARNIVLAEFWRELATIDGKASAVGNYAVFHGNYEKLFRLPADMEAVTSEDLRAVAAQVFRVNNMTVGVLRAPDAEGSQ
jgi:zinc protease